MDMQQFNDMVNKWIDNTIQWFKNLPEDRRQQLKQQWKNMTPQERQNARQQIKRMQKIKVPPGKAVGKRRCTH